MKHYQTDEFLFGSIAEIKSVAVEKKMTLLRDFCLLTQQNKDKVRELLNSCPHELAMTRLLHNVLCGDTTVDELLAQKGVM